MAERCDRCGHAIGARCSECGREMLCGDAAGPCPVIGCLEGVLPRPSSDLQGGPVEAPRLRGQDKAAPDAIRTYFDVRAD